MWIPALNISELEKGSGRMVDLGGVKIALFNIQGKYYALKNSCMHRGASLGDGHLEGTKVTCPWHAWEFDVKTGACDMLPEEKQPTYSTKVEKDTIWIDLPKNPA